MSSSLHRERRKGACAPEVEVRICQTWEEMQVLRPEWNEILSDSPDCSMFSSPEWLAAWWKSYGAERELVNLCFLTLDGKLLGLAPLYRDEIIAFGRKLKVLRLVGDGSKDSDNLNFIIRSGYEKACADGFLLWLRRWGGWDLCILDTLPDTSVFGNALLQQLRTREWSVLESVSTHLFIRLPDKWETYLECLPPDFRSLITRYPRRLRGRHKVNVYQCSTPTTLRKGLAALFSLHQKRWQNRGDKGVFENPQRCRLYHEIALIFLERGALEFWLMDLNGVTVAAQFCVRSGSTVYLLQEGFDPQYKREKVGYALRAAVLQDLIRRGVQVYDFLGGNDPYKLRFGAEKSTYLRIEFARPFTLASGRLTLSRLNHQLRRWAHSNLPEPLVCSLRRVLHNVTGNR